MQFSRRATNLEENHILCCITGSNTDEDTLPSFLWQETLLNVLGWENYHQRICGYAKRTGFAPLSAPGPIKSPHILKTVHGRQPSDVTTLPRCLPIPSHY